MSHPGYREKVFAALPGTVDQLMNKTGLGRSAVYRWLAELREDGRCYVARWSRGTGRYVATFAAGNRPDVPKPVRRTSAQYNVKYRERKAKAEAPFRQARAAGIEAAERTARLGDPVIGDLMAALCRPVRQEARP